MRSARRSSASSSRIGSATDYRGMRYGLASCLMDDGYYYYNDDAHENYGRPVVRRVRCEARRRGQQAADVGLAVGRLSPRLRERHRAGEPEGQRLARRSRSSGTFMKLKGTQDSTVNNGATVTAR